MSDLLWNGDFLVGSGSDAAVVGVERKRFKAGQLLAHCLDLVSY